MTIDAKRNITEEFTVTYFGVPSDARYLPPYENISQQETDYFDEEEDAWSFALEKASEGFFDVKAFAEYSEDGDEIILFDDQSLGCPYIAQNIDEELNELMWHREEVQQNLCEPECLQKWRYEELKESLQKLNREIEQIVGTSDARAL